MKILLLAALFVVAASTAIDFDFSAFADTAAENADLKDTSAESCDLGATIIDELIWRNCSFRKLAFNNITIM